MVADGLRAQHQAPGGNLVSFQAAAAVPLVGAYGVGYPEALSFAVVLHAVQALSAVVPGLAALAVEGLGSQALPVEAGSLRRDAAGIGDP